jgi:hypothetical protein
MDEWMFHRPSGEYILKTEKHEKHDQRYYAFLPHPLTGNLAIKIDEELTSLLSTANRLLGRLDGMSAFLPNPVAVEKIMMFKEALLSCQIDGINAPLCNVLDSSRKADKLTAPVRKCASALLLGIERMSTSSYKNELLCQRQFWSHVAKSAKK